MSPTALADPLAASHVVIVDQLEPFCDGLLDRFSDHELLDAYDLAVAWTHDLPAAQAAVKNIAAEWHARYRRNLPRGDSDLGSVVAELAAPFDHTSPVFAAS